MKYVFVNIKNFIFRDFGMFFLVMLCSIVSAIVISFSYGVYENNKVSLALVRAGSFHDYLNIEFVEGEDGSCVSKAEFVECLSQLQEKFSDWYNTIDYCTAYVIADGDRYECWFGFDGDGIKLEEETYENLRMGDMLTGEVWTDEDEKNGSRYALCYDYSKFGGENPILDKIYVDDETLIIDGNEYTIIGWQSWNCDGAMVPFMSFNDDAAVDGITIHFDQGLFLNTYQDICNVFSEELGDKAVVDEISMSSFSNNKFFEYKTMTLVVILLALISALNFAILYKFIIEKRKKSTRVFWILGKSKKRIIGMNILEFLIVNVPAFLIGTLIYVYFIVDKVLKYYQYIDKFCGFVLEGQIFLIYMAVSLIVYFIMLMVTYRNGGIVKS